MRYRFKEKKVGRMRDKYRQIEWEGKEKLKGGTRVREKQIGTDKCKERETERVNEKKKKQRGRNKKNREKKIEKERERQEKCPSVKSRPSSVTNATAVILILTKRLIKIKFNKIKRLKCVFNLN